jgi:hypothetical protein
MRSSPLNGGNVDEHCRGSHRFQEIGATPRVAPGPIIAAALKAAGLMQS